MEQHTDAVFRLTPEGNHDRSQNKHGQKMHRAKRMNSNNSEAITINQLYNTNIKKM